MTGPERYDRLAPLFVHPYTRVLLRSITPVPHARILDHGAGTGEVTLALHRHFPQATVVALDPSAAMLDRLRAKVGPDTPWLTLYPGTLPPKGLGPFDLCMIQLSLVYAPDPQTELTALHRSTMDGGRLALIVLGAAETMVPFFAYWAAVQHVLSDAIPPASYPHHRFANGRTLQQMAQRAGWQEARVQQVEAVRICSEPTLWRWVSSTLPILRSYGQAVDVTADVAMAGNVRQAVRDIIEPYRYGNSYQLPTAGCLLTGRAG